MNSIQGMASPEEKLPKRFDSWRQREQHTYLQNMKFDHTKHDIEQFTYDLKVLGKMIDMSDSRFNENQKFSK